MELVISIGKERISKDQNKSLQRVELEGGMSMVGKPDRQPIVGGGRSMEELHSN